MHDNPLFWAITTGIGLCFSVIGVLIKTIWSNVFGELRSWKGAIEKEGGVVTRDKHFQWCRDKQATCSGEIVCRLSETEEWRDAMFEKGGPLTLQQHETICERVTAKAAGVFISKLEDSLKHHQELVKKDMEIVMLSVKDAVAQAVKEIKEANGRK